MPLPGRAIPPLLPLEPMPPAPAPSPPPAPLPLAPPLNCRASDEKPAFLLNSICVTLASALTIGLPFARAMISCSRACLTRDAAIAMSGLSRSARMISESSVASPKTVHQVAGSITAPVGCGPTNAPGTGVSGG